jgi:two-component system sensor histidine kinase ChvG
VPDTALQAAEAAAPPPTRHAPPSRAHGARSLLSPLLRRILLVNALPVALLAAALLYLGDYQKGLVDAAVSGLRTQAQIYAGAIGESATNVENPDAPSINADLARPLLRRIVEPTPGAQARLFGPDGVLIADSRVLPGPGGTVVTEPLPALEPPRGPFGRLVEEGYDAAMALLVRGIAYPTIPEGADWMPDLAAAFPRIAEGEAPPVLRRTADGRLVVSVAVPVSRNRRTVGVVVLTREAREVDAAVFQVRMTILATVALALVVTVGMSVYLAATIARPVRRLARAAERMREGRGRSGSVPRNLVARRDEIGELADALDESATALWARMDAIERFAADVAHEIKNPLTSIRSAIETLRRLDDPERQQRLLSIMAEDVQRLDRLISDISDASRVDAELSRTPTERVDLGPILATLAELNEATRSEGGAHLVVEAPAEGLAVRAVEGRLVQVLRNLIANAVSFSPADGTIRLTGRQLGATVEIAVEDEGPGIPEARLEHVFERFYSERPRGEKFGSHSGLGLSISRQIVEALRGTITAENRRGEDGRVAGARFVVRLPAA